MGSFCLAVNAHSKHKDLANRFVDYLDSPKGMMEMLYGPENPVGIIRMEKRILQITDILIWKIHP